MLPDSGVATVYPKMEHIKEDFAKMLTDWQEHIGSLQVLLIVSVEYSTKELFSVSKKLRFV